jgi:hypothetical protein
MDEAKLIFFGIGTLAFFAAVYLAIQHPELVELPGEVRQEFSSHSLRKWDDLIAWVMWGGWGCAAVLTFLDRAGYLDVLEL